MAMCSSYYWLQLLIVVIYLEISLQSENVVPLTLAAGSKLANKILPHLQKFGCSDNLPPLGKRVVFARSLHGSACMLLLTACTCIAIIMLHYSSFLYLSICQFKGFISALRLQYPANLLIQRREWGCFSWTINLVQQRWAMVWFTEIF